jgi:hypothetical protein
MEMYHLPGDGCNMEELLDFNAEKRLRIGSGNGLSQRKTAPLVRLSGIMSGGLESVYIRREILRFECRNTDATGHIAHNVANVSISLIFDVRGAIP